MPDEPTPGVTRKDGEPTTTVDEEQWTEGGPKRHRLGFEGVAQDDPTPFTPAEGDTAYLTTNDFPDPETIAKNLTDQENRFIEHLFAESLDWEKAVVLAGYRGNTKSTVQRLRAKPLVAMLVLHRLETMRDSQRITLEKVEGMLIDEAEDKRDIKSNSQSARVGALGTLARLKGGFEKGQTERARPVAINIDFEDILGMPRTQAEIEENADE